MRGNSRKRAAIVAGLVGVAVLIGSGTASAAPQPDAATGKYCVTTLKKLKPGETASEVVSRKCSNDPALATSAASAENVLVTLYTDNDYKGHWEMFFGQDGPCDKSGYGINWVGFEMENATSSLITHSWCNDVTLYNWSGRDPGGGTYRLRSLGTEISGWEALPGFNDATSSLHLSQY
ncbi:hypothetical protein [Amycolatopsis pittospori]|uniref:hypothetical protein n=1 Tax=Amycolatopsis pittospori TaxID=2749434 RepID=UPI0015F0F98B|nr:hypothetical protein [Amycolatopsis pittospori]